MSDPPTIAPALTPKEWTRGVDLAYGLWWASLEGADSPEAALAGLGEVEACGQSAPWLLLSSQSAHPNGVVSRRHALAALALHGQPFGFTRQLDVEGLREIAKFLRLCGHLGAALVDDLAARIEALLPPDAQP